MRAALRSIEFQPDPPTLSGDPADFSFLVRLIVGPSDAPGEEIFDVTVCTPEWLATASRRAGGLYDARHHVVVNLDEFNQRALRDWLASEFTKWRRPAGRRSASGSDASVTGSSGTTTPTVERAERQISAFGQRRGRRTSRLPTPPSHRPDRIWAWEWTFTWAHSPATPLVTG